MQYCRTPAALPALIPLTLGKPDAMDGMFNWAADGELVQATQTAIAM